MKLLASRCDQDHAGADRKRIRILAGPVRNKVPVAEDILETDPAGQAWSSGPTETSSIRPTKSGLVHRNSSLRAD